MFQLIAGPGRPWKKRCVVMVRRSALAAFASIHAVQALNRQSVVSQMPIKPNRLASSNDVSPDDHNSPGVYGAG